MTDTTERGFAAQWEDFAKQRRLEEGTDLLAEVRDINENYVVVNAGLKSEASIPRDEFYNDEHQLEVKIGDEVEVEIELLENGRGEAILSRRNTRRKQAWRRVEEAMENDGVLEGTVFSRVKGGYSVSLDGLRAFLPGSLVDVFPQADPAAIVGQRMVFRPIKANAARNSLVVSRRAVIEREMLEAKDNNFVANLTEGTRCKGKVRAILEYGAFIEIAAGVYGLLHITDISWKHTVSVNDVMEKDDEIEVVVISVDRDTGRISLGMKQLQPNPWEFLERTHPVGSRVFGKVKCVMEYGIFVEVDDGVQGLVHSSEMSWTRKNPHPGKIYNEGDEVEVTILGIDVERRRISMGIKQCLPNPWQDFATAYRKGERVSGTVRSVNEFGVFVELTGGIDGLIRMADLSYYRQGEEVAREYTKGQEIETVILNIEVERERISLGVKQLDNDGFGAFSEKHLRGSAVRGTITSIVEKGAHIKLEGGVRGFLPIGEISEERVENVGEHVKEGDEMDFVLLSSDAQKMMAFVSLKEKDRQQREKALSERKQKASSTSSKNTLGAMLQAKILENEKAADENEKTADEAEDKE